MLPTSRPMVASRRIDLGPSAAAAEGRCRIAPGANSLPDRACCFVAFALSTVAAGLLLALFLRWRRLL